MSRPTQPRRDVVIVVIVVVVVVAGAAILWRTGGLEPAQQLGPKQPADQVFKGARWDLQFEDAAVELDYDDQPELVIAVTGTWQGEETTHSPQEQVVAVILPDGTTVTDLTWSPEVGFGEPGVTSRAEITIAEVPLPPGDVPITIAVRDERQHDSFISADSWQVLSALGHTELTAVDTR